MPPSNPLGRLAFREEGSWWNAYYAQPDTMRDAVLLGSITMGIARNPAVKAAFMQVMRQAVTDILSHVGRVEWPNEAVPAPEHERTKDA